MKDFSIVNKITKLVPDQNLVFGWASVVNKDGGEVVDSYGDTIAPEELEVAVYEYVLNKREAGEMHEVTTGVGQLVESVMITKEKIAAMGLPETTPLGWWVGYKVSDEVFAKVKDGTYPMLSIGGKAIRETDDGK